MIAQDHILVVNANPVQQQETVRLLERAGYSVSAASSGREVFSLCDTFRPDLILLDPELPDINGLVLCQQLKAGSDDQCDPLVLFLAAASSGATYRARALEAGADGFLTRPLTDREFLAEISAFLRIRSRARRMKDSEAQLRHVIMHNADGMIVVDQAGMVQFANAAAENLFEVAPGGLLQQHFGFPIGTSDVAAEIEIVSRERLRTVEMRVVELVWDHRSAYLASLRDISERKIAEEQRVQLAVEQQKVRFLSSFVGGISHEIATPLTSIMFSLERIKRSVQLPEALAAAVRQSQDAIYYIDGLVGSMLILARLESDPNLDFAPIILNTLVREVVDSLRDAAAERAITLELDLDDAPLMVEGNTDLLSEALKQVLDNALTFSEAETPIRIIAFREQQSAVIVIQDNGIGIDEADLPHIFTHFYRADKARTIRRGGLGLTIAQKVIETHRGHITVQSKLGSGTHVTICLPLVASA